MSVRGEINTRIREARKQGFTVKISGNGHWHFERGGRRVVVSVSPSNNNAMHRIDAELKKAGFVFDNKRRLKQS